MGITFEYPDGATPLNQDEIEALLPRHITTQKQLNEWEAENVLKGSRWAFENRSRHGNVLATGFMKALHRQMFDETWRWAGSIRQRDTLPGIPPENIRTAVEELFSDVVAQLENKAMSLDDIAARFHHRLAYIHPFPNGNGRLCRAMADLVLLQNGADQFTWGNGNLVDEGEVRSRYLSALRSADARDFNPLFAFVRS